MKFHRSLKNNTLAIAAVSIALSMNTFSTIANEENNLVASSMQTMPVDPSCSGIVMNDWVVRRNASSKPVTKEIGQMAKLLHSSYDSISMKSWMDRRNASSKSLTNDSGHSTKRSMSSGDSISMNSWMVRRNASSKPIQRQ